MMKRVIVALALSLSLASQAQAMSPEACTVYAGISTDALKMRQNGEKKNDIMEKLKEGQSVKDIAVLATIRAFKADVEVEPEDFRASTFKRCRANEL